MIYAKLRPVVGAILLMSGASSASALTLGQSTASVVLGRALDFQVPATVNADESVSGLCIEADVFQGDALISPARVTVQLSRGAAGLSTLRVISNVIIEEPVLTIVIRHGCLSKNSRRYVVLVDPPLITNRAGALNGSETGAEGRSIGGTAVGSLAASELNRADRPVREPISRSDAVTNRRAAKPSRPTTEAVATKSRPRLQLDAVEMRGEPLIGPLKATMELLTVPSDSVSTQRLEAAALWKVLGASPEDLLAENQRLTALKAEAVGLRQSMAKSQSEVSQLSAQLRDAEASQYKNPLVYALIALIALLSGLFLIFRSKRKIEKSSAPWWKPTREEKESSDLPSSGPRKETNGSKTQIKNRELVTSAGTDQKAGIPQRGESEAGSSQVKPRFVESAYATLGSHGSARGVNVEELFDIQQQSEFFISLGQHDQAIEVLQNYIQETTQTSPLVYLDLLKLYHRQELRSEYKQLTTEFGRLFNAELPEFDAFKDQTLGLEAFYATLSPIVSAWNTGDVLRIIEESLFRQVGRSAETLDLEAYRELLLLHAIAKDLFDVHALKEVDQQGILGAQAGLIEGEIPEATSPFANYNQTIPQVLTPVIHESSLDRGSSEIRSGTVHKPLGSRIGLDIDLSSVAADPGVEPNVILSEAPLPSDGSNTQNSGLIEFDLDSFDSFKSKDAPKK